MLPSLVPLSLAISLLPNGTTVLAAMVEGHDKRVSLSVMNHNRVVIARIFLGFSSARHVCDPCCPLHYA